METKFKILLIVSLFGLWLMPGRAQDNVDHQDNADQAGQDILQPTDTSKIIEETIKVQTFDPDDRPLSGSEDVSLGTPEAVKNILNYSVRVDEMLNSNPRASFGRGYTWQGDQDVFGTIAVNRTWNQNSFKAQYDGGGIFYAGQDARSVHTFSLAQEFSLNRWQLRLSNQLIYSPESPYGLPGPQPSSTNPLGTDNTLLPNQTILTNQVSSLSNTSIGEASYGLTHYSSITAYALYSLLDYFASEAYNVNQRLGALGYSHSLSPHDKVAVTYAYAQFNFNLGKTDVQTANLRYAHQVLGRVSAEIEGGAQLVNIYGYKIQLRDRIYPDGRFTLNYAWHRSQLSLAVARSVLSGAGLFIATNSTIASATLSRALSRKWNTSVSSGFAQNSTIGGVSQQYRTGFAAINLHRDVRRHADLYLTYNFQKQVGNKTCTGAVCAGPFLRQTVGVGLNWRFTPIPLH